MINRTVTARQMKEIDRIAIEEYGIAGAVLMENAGIQTAEVALQILAERKNNKITSDIAGEKKVSVFCGKGNNGGDGFVVARHLLNKGIKVNVFLAASKNDVQSDALINLNILLKMGQKVEEILPASRRTLQAFFEKFHQSVFQADLIIDALLGTGISGLVTEPYQSIINLINQINRPVLAVDTPSGLDVDTGEVLGVCVRATKTVTFGLAKKGFYLNEGPEYVGEVIVADISLPRNLLR